MYRPLKEAASSHRVAMVSWKFPGSFESSVDFSQKTGWEFREGCLTMVESIVSGARLLDSKMSLVV